MQSGRYHVKSPTVAIFDEENGLVAIRMVPAGAIITVEGPGAENDRLIDVVWDGKRAMMFTRDLQSRAERDEGSQ
jgi:hypothetical protein